MSEDIYVWKTVRLRNIENIAQNDSNETPIKDYELQENKNNTTTLTKILLKDSYESTLQHITKDINKE